MYFFWKLRPENLNLSFKYSLFKNQWNQPYIDVHSVSKIQDINTMQQDNIHET